MTTEQQLNAMNTTVAANEEEEDYYYQAETLALILPRITAVISLFAIVGVAMEASADLAIARQRQRNSSIVTTRNNRVRASGANAVSTIITRIQLFYQIPLFCHALAFALGTTPAPANLEVWGAVGNTATCEAQGFLLQFGIFGNVGWDVALSTAYLLMVRYNVPSARLLKMEKYYHLVIWPTVLLLCIYPLVMQMYNINHSVCWLESYPNDCVGEECERGAGAPLMQTVASGIGVLHLLYSITVMLLIYCAIRGMENRNQRYGSSNFTTATTATAATGDSAATATATITATNRRYSRAVAIQGMLYASGMIMTTLPTAVYIALYNFTGLWSPGFGIFATSLTPLMGYVNFVIFIRGRRKVEDCQTQYGKLLRQLHTCCFDYRLICECKCHCVSIHNEDEADVEAPSPSKKKNKPQRQLQDAATAPTAPTATTKTVTKKKKKTGGDGQQQEEETAPTAQQPRQAKQEHEHEDEAVEDEEEDEDDNSVVSDTLRGRFTGTWIHKKSKASLVSELEGSEFDIIDVSPCKPVRIRSEVEQPPIPPKRVISEVLDNNLDEDEDEDNDEDEEQGMKPSRVHEAPPTKPVRLESSCVLPAAVVNEMSQLSFSSFSQSDVVESCAAASTSSPPIKPQRYVSEMDDSGCSSSYDSSSSGDPPQGTTLDAQSIACTRGDTSSCLQKKKHSKDGPIHRPMRYESEIPAEQDSYEAEEEEPSSSSSFSDDDESNSNNSNMRGNLVPSSSPSMPIRLISEVSAAEIQD